MPYCIVLWSHQHQRTSRGSFLFSVSLLTISFELTLQAAIFFSLEVVISPNAPESFLRPRCCVPFSENHLRYFVPVRCNDKIYIPCCFVTVLTLLLKRIITVTFRWDGFAPLFLYFDFQISNKMDHFCYFGLSGISCPVSFPRYRTW